MDIVSFREFCLSLKGTTEEMPFDDKILVFKVMGKIFALTDIDTFERINLKCEPQKALELRQQYEGVKAGYHMNKKHWNTVLTKGKLHDSLLKEMILHSYDLVVENLSKKQKQELNNLSD